MGITFAKLRRGIAMCTAAVLIAWPLTGEWARSVASAAQSAPAAQKTEIRVVIDGEPHAFTPAPIQQNGVTLVPMRQIFNVLGARVTWVPATKSVFAQKDGVTVSLQLDSKHAVVNGKTIVLDVPVRVVDGVTMVPLRLVADAFGAKVRWEQASRTVRIETPEYRRQQEGQERQQREDAREPLTPAEIVELNDDRVVMITTDSGQGSGVIVGSRWVLTNWHVINGASSGNVILNDGSVISIQGVAASDKDTDLAIVQTARPLGVLPVTFAKSFTVRKGDRIVAIGSPLGYQNTVSEGLISNFTREGFTTYYQINAPIDRGSSGGAVFNEHGELVGITTGAIRDTQADINFAVPADYAEWLLRDLEANPPAASRIKFPESRLPDSLEGATDEQIRALLEVEFGSVQTKKGTATFSDWTVTRDAQGWLVVTAVISPSFYMLYGSDARTDLRNWAIGLAVEMRRMLPDVNFELIVYYSQVFNAEPRGFEPGVVTNLGDGRWRVRYEVMHLQYLDRLHLSDNL